MKAPPHSQVSIAGHRLTIRPPDTAIEVLELTIFHTANTLEHMATMPRARDVDALCRWCAAYVLDVDTAEWADFDEARRAAFLDREFAWKELRALNEQIVELASLPAELVADVERFWTIACKGGCECPICDGGREPTERLLKACQYAQLHESTERVVESTAMLGDKPALQAPWWLYQLQQAQARGKNRAAYERRKDKDRKSGVDQALKNRGINA
ncbi:MAG: hypothetical protein ACLFVJ_07360 [Persicimonas sp.]